MGTTHLGRLPKAAAIWPPIRLPIRAANLYRRMVGRRREIGDQRIHLPYLFREGEGERVEDQYAKKQTVEQLLERA